MHRCVLHVDLDAFFVAVEQARNPELRGKPVVVGGRANARGIVATASYEARAFGLRSGMALSTAYRLCPQATFIPADFHRYREASARFKRILADYTPDIESMGLDEAYLDLTGFEPIYGSARRVAEEIQQRVRQEVGITGSVGIATSKVVAKVASDLRKPEGLVEVPPGEEAAFLAPLAVGRLPMVGPKTEKTLRAMGITTIGQLARRSPAVLRQSFGIHGETLYRYANGLDERTVSPPGPPKSIGRETTFAEDICDRQLLTATLRYLAERVGAALRKEKKLAWCVAFKLRYADFHTISRHLTLRRPTDIDGVVFQAGREMLEKALAQRWERVRLIGIGVTGLVTGGHQLEMLDTTTHRMVSLLRAIDRLREKYGVTAIQLGETPGRRAAFSVRDADYVLDNPSVSQRPGETLPP